MSRTDGFHPYPKTPRLNKPTLVTEKLDGTNAQVAVFHQDDVLLESLPYQLAQHGVLCVFAGSRNRWVTPDADNYGFAAWVAGNSVQLAKLGEGRQYGEWWGQGIQRGYGLDHKRFSLFNVGRWSDSHGTNDGSGVGDELAPDCCHVVPLLAARGSIDDAVDDALLLLEHGSIAAPGYGRPEGVVAFHTAARQTFKVLLDKAGG